MIIEVESNQLTIGMYIILSDSLFENPFWKAHFKLEKKQQIDKIIHAKIKSVKVDTEKSSVEVPVEESSDTEQIQSSNINKTVNNTPKTDSKAKESIIEVKTRDTFIKEATTPPDEWNPQKFMPPQLVEAFKDTKLAPSDRAKVVNDYSHEMMKNILETPSAENITATKKGIAEIVDVIMDEGDTCDNLTKIVSHDYYTYTHSVNVGIKSILLAKEFYGDSQIHNMHELGAGFFLHDIGKVNISAEIINKRGRLSESEMNEMRKHPEESKKILTYTHHINKEFEIIVMQHHERDDGSGYPLGLKGFEIHPYASICCLADVYDALTGKRSYKVSKTPQEALQIMTKEMKNHFNLEMLNKFISLFERSGVLEKVL